VCEIFLIAIEKRLKELSDKCEELKEVLVQLDFLKHCIKRYDDEEKELLRRMVERLTESLKRLQYHN